MRRGVLALAALAALLAAAALWISTGGARSSAAEPPLQLQADAGAPPIAPQVAARQTEIERQGPEAVAVDPAAPEEPAPAVREVDDPVLQVAWGYVLDERGQPLAGGARCWVQLVDELGVVRKTELGFDGTWSLAGLAPGRWHATAGALGMRDDHAVLELAPTAEPLRYDFRLEREPELRVKLLARDGRPFFQAARDAKLPPLGLVAVATKEPPGATFHGVRGSLNNRFGVGRMWHNGEADVRLPDEFWGVVRLEVPPPVHLSLVLYHDVLQTQPVGPRQDEVMFRIDPDEVAARLGALRLQAVDAAGAPVGGSVFLEGHAVGGSHPLGSDGRLLLEGRLPGRYGLTLLAKGLASVTREIEIPAGGVLDLGTLVLAEPTPIRGRVVDAEGAPFAASVNLAPLPEPGVRPQRGSNHLTASDGSFELGGVGPGLWLLQVSSRRSGISYLDVTHLAHSLVIDTRRGPVEGLVVQVEAVSYAAVSWSGSDRSGLKLRFVDDKGLVRQSGSFWHEGPFRFPLPPGPWRAVVEDASCAAVDERTFELGSEPLRVELGPR